MLFRLILSIGFYFCCEVSSVSGITCPESTCPLYNQGVSAADQQLIVQLHNDYRQLIANGQQNGFQTAADMSEITWDKDLENMAQTWAYGCQFEHAPNECKPNSHGWLWVGENLFTSWRYSANDAANWTGAVSDWYKEYKDYPPSKINKFDNNAGRGKMVGHFTQVVWAKTYRIGCGFSIFDNPPTSPYPDYPYQQLYVCNYGPGGNIVDAPIYEQGAPCSKCPNQGCGTIQGLCAPQ